jgi:preprotein translocase subunit SecD
MKPFRTVTRVLAPFSLLVLAACQTTQGPGAADASSGSSSAAQATATAAATPETSTADQTQAAQNQGVPVAVYLADTNQHEGWAQVDIQSGALYLRPEPVITREDLTGVQAGANQQGAGLLALELSEDGRQKVTRITGRYPNMRLALVVGRTMLAAPGYTTPVTSPQLVFGVGSEQNAALAARAIAGVPPDGSGDSAASTKQ